MRWGIAMDPLAIGWVSLSLSLPPSLPPHTHEKGREGGRKRKLPQICACRKRGTASNCLVHDWLKTEQKDVKKIGTKRLKSFRARRRWLVS